MQEFEVTEIREVTILADNAGEAAIKAQQIFSGEVLRESDKVPGQVKKGVSIRSLDTRLIDY